MWQCIFDIKICVLNRCNPLISVLFAYVTFFRVSLFIITVLENIKVDTLYTHLKLSVFEMWNIISLFFQAIFFLVAKNIQYLFFVNVIIKVLTESLSLKL